MSTSAYKFLRRVHPATRMLLLPRRDSRRLMNAQNDLLERLLCCQLPHPPHDPDCEGKDEQGTDWHEDHRDRVHQYSLGLLLARVKPDHDDPSSGQVTGDHSQPAYRILHCCTAFTGGNGQSHITRTSAAEPIVIQLLTFACPVRCPRCPCLNLI